MAFIASAATINIKGKLTPLGRQKLATNNNGLITSFSLGDSDANYNVFTGLTAGNVPDFSGDNFGASTNDGGANYLLRSKLYYRGRVTNKPVESSSIIINTSFANVGYNTVPFSAGSLTQLIINRNNFNTDEHTNLFYSFGMPINSQQAATYTAKTSINGGFSNTALSGLASTKALVISIASGEYGELIDGKTIKLDVTTTGNTYAIYGTYQNKGGRLTTEDMRVYDTSSNLKQFGPNRCLLFSDQVKRPNGNPNKSWATGYGLNKPFSLNRKELWNFKTNSALSQTADTAVGIAYLDKGMLVLTDPTLVSDFESGLAFNNSGTTATTVMFNSVVSKVSQQFTCIADRKEFGVSNNPTFGEGDVPRITEIGLYDNANNLIAIAKTSRTYYKPEDDIVVFNLVIDY